MTIIYEFFRGFGFAFGLMAGFILPLILLRLVKRNRKKEYSADDLVLPFENYLQKITSEEQYEEIKTVNAILTELRSGNVPQDVELFKIKKDSSLNLNDEGSSMAFKVVTQYIVLKKK